MTVTRAIVRELAVAGMRYRLLADNAVDVATHVRGVEVVWVSPSVQDACGWPAEAWIGTDFTPASFPMTSKHRRPC